MINELIKYQQWRTGEIDERLDEIGLTPARITACINWAIESLTTGKAAHDAEVAKKAVQAALRMYGNADLSNKEIMALSENYAASLNK